MGVVTLKHPFHVCVKLSKPNLAADYQSLQGLSVKTQVLQMAIVVKLCSYLDTYRALNSWKDTNTHHVWKLHPNLNLCYSCLGKFPHFSSCIGSELRHAFG